MNTPQPSDTAVSRRVPQQGHYVETQPFWRALGNGRLALQYCPATGRFQHPPAPVSVTTGRRATEWREVCGLGHIYAYTVVRIAGPGLQGRLPLCVATVELDEKVRIIANLLDCNPDEPVIGARVRLAMDRLDSDVPYPAFVLVR